jgi:hypothetical protein
MCVILSGNKQTHNSSQRGPAARALFGSPAPALHVRAFTLSLSLSASLLNL